ncbi:IS630 family transposase [Micromonospora rosaria]|uniref:IS630 family transposase n=1 Tax=Micromonospora rosaria TaxID=47874 RepID=UPI000832D1E9|nr:IS630 family transposase [Micromonospora rosaria]
MGKGRPKTALTLSDEERAQLGRGARAASSTQAYALRCRIVLACADGATNAEVAARFGVSPPTVGKWRSRFVAHRMSGLADAPRTGRPTTVGQDRVRQVVTATLDAPPDRTRRWSRAAMAAHSGLSASTVGRIWRRFDLRPHLQDGLRLATDLRFVARVVDVVGIYEHLPERAVVLCTDENRPAAAPAPAPPGGPDPCLPSPDTTDPPAPPDVVGAAGAGEPDRRARGCAYRRFLRAVDRAVPADLDVHVISDNVALHDTAPVRAWLARHPRFHVHFTPAGPTWRDQAAQWVARFGGTVPALAPEPTPPGPAATDPGAPVAGAGHPECLAWVKAAEAVRDALDRHLERTCGVAAPAGRQAAER